MGLSLKHGLQVAVAVSCGVSGLAAAAPGAPDSAAITPELRPFVEDGTVAGVVALAADKDKILSIDAVGYASLYGQG